MGICDARLRSIEKLLPIVFAEALFFVVLLASFRIFPCLGFALFARVGIAIFVAACASLRTVCAAVGFPVGAIGEIHHHAAFAHLGLAILPITSSACSSGTSKNEQLFSKSMRPISTFPFT